MADDELTLEELNKLDDKQRKAMMRQTAREVKALLTNEKGLRRLLAITDEEWQRAVDEDEGVEGGPA